MASKVQIANRALQKVGAKRIVDFDENSVNANEINACYDLLRDAELETNIWRFSLVRVQLPALTATPAFGRDFQYQLPADFVRPAPLDPDFNDLPEDLLFEGTKVLSDDSGPLNMRYVSRDTPTEYYSPLFVEALAARISIEVCEKLTQSNTKKDSLESSYTFHVNKARAVNAIIRGPTQGEEDEWVYARL